MTTESKPSNDPQNTTEGQGEPQSVSQPPAQGGNPAAEGGQPDGQGGTPSTPSGQQTDAGGQRADGHEGDDGQGKPADPSGEYQFQAPEGMELDTEAMEAFTPVAKELGLNNEQAQKLVDLYATRMQSNTEAQTEEWQRQIEQWETDLKNDPDIGGRQFDASIQAAGQAMDRFATPELREFLDQTGMGSHPEMVKLMAKIGKAIGEDDFVSPPGSSGTQEPAGDKTYADILYGGGS